MVDMIEKYLGPFGRPLITLLILSVTLGLIAWSINMLWTKLIAPVYHYSVIEWEVNPLAVFWLQPIAVLVLLLILVWLLDYFLIQPIHKREMAKQAQLDGETMRPNEDDPL